MPKHRHSLSGATSGLIYVVQGRSGDGAELLIGLVVLLSGHSNGTMASGRVFYVQGLRIGHLVW